MGKLTKFTIDMILSTHLYGMPLFDNLLSKISFDTDDQQNIPDNVVDNIKTILKVTIVELKKKGEETFIFKIKSALKSLLDYGTKENSDRMTDFLTKLDGNTKRLVSLSEIETNYLNLFDNLNFSADKLPALQQLMNEVQQT